jgi:truncated hemoglobin YjbI
MSTEHQNDDLRALRELGPIEPPRELGHRVRRHGRAEIEAASAGSWLTLATRAWTRVGLPVALAATVVVYLSWAVTSASALYR